MSMNWHHSHITWIAVAVVSEEGRASVQVWINFALLPFFSGLIFYKLIGEVCMDFYTCNWVLAIRMIE